MSGANLENAVSEVALTVTAGTPSDEELAVLLVALSTLAAPAAAAPTPEPSGWVDRARGIGTTRRPGPGAWLASARR